MMKKKWVRKCVIIAVWLLIWQGVSLLIHNPVLFVGPWETVQAAGRLVTEGEFYKTLLHTVLRILGGILLGCGAGFALAGLGQKFRFVREFLEPAISLGKAVPVASFVILILIWFGNLWVAMAVVFLVTLPIAYLNLQAGLVSLDPGLQEMAQVFRITGVRKFRYVELPQLRPQIRAALSLAVGMGFKSGIAAEVIGQAGLTIGNSLYRSKIYLETADLFAWTAVVIFLSWGTEKLLMLLIRRLGA